MACRLPLTSRPVSIFLAVEQGLDFAAAAARRTLLETSLVWTYSIAAGVAVALNGLSLLVLFHARRAAG
jgi:hypothetical protein